MAEIFSKIAGGINKGVVTVSANSKAMLEKTKIKTVIDNLENERKQLVFLLGTKIHGMHKASGEVMIDTGIENMFAEINKRDELIAQQKEQLLQVEAELRLAVSGGSSIEQSGITCTCGHINHKEAKFCAKCGSPQQTEPAVSAGADIEAKSISAAVQDGFVCACGHLSPEGTKFCAKCGSLFQAPPAPAGHTGS